MEPMTITVTRAQLAAVFLRRGHADWDEIDAELMADAVFAELAPESV